MYKKTLPQRLKDSIKVLLGIAKVVTVEVSSKVTQHSSFCCPVCDSPIEKFNALPDSYYEILDRHGFMFSIFQCETLNWLNYTCPVCRANDRDRLYSLYLQKEVSIDLSEFKFLDIAPSSSLQKFIKTRYPHIKYRCADLMMSGVDDVIDITRMDIYEDNVFDFLICSHILEHVHDDTKAMSELFRVLKPSGKGIVMVPIMLSLEKDYENPAITTPEGCWKHFGQDDHVRMYSKQEFVSKLINTGFLVHQLDINFFGSESFGKHGIHNRSVLYIVEKTG